MRIFSIFTFILGLLFALIQINDPDPLIWIGIYLQLVILATLHLLDRKPLWYAAALTLFFTAGFIKFIPDIIQWIKDGMPSVVESMKAESPYIELVREGGGMLICLIFAAVFFTDWYKHQRKLF